MGSLSIPSIFNHDDFKRAVPSLRAGCEWVMTDSNALMTIKLDGIAIRVKWNSTTMQWDLEQLHSNGMMDLPLERKFTEDEHIFKAFDKASVKMSGLFILYGKDINGNPHGLNGSYWVKMAPVSHELLVQRHKTIVARWTSTTVQQFYDSVRQELTESPEIHGLVFHRENEKLETVAMAKVTRAEFGLEWPAKKVEQLQLIGSQS